MRWLDERNLAGIGNWESRRLATLTAGWLAEGLFFSGARGGEEEKEGSGPVSGEV